MSNRYDPPKLPEESILELEDYLAMQPAVSEQTRYRIVAELLRQGEMSAKELADALGIPSNKLHYHLDRLMDVGVVAIAWRKCAARTASTPTTSPPRSGKPS